MMMKIVTVRPLILAFESI